MNAMGSAKSCPHETRAELTHPRALRRRQHVLERAARLRDDRAHFFLAFAVDACDGSHLPRHDRIDTRLLFSGELELACEMLAERAWLEARAHCRLQAGGSCTEFGNATLDTRVQSVPIDGIIWNG